MPEITIAEYSKSRLLTFGLGPIAFLVIGYLMFSPLTLAEVFSDENFRDTRNPVIGGVAAVVCVVWLIYQMITILLLKKRFVWLKGTDLMVGYSNRGDFRSLRLDEAEIDAKRWHDLVSIPVENRSPIVLRTGLARTTGAELVARLKQARLSGH